MLSFSSLKKTDLLELIKFVVRENYNHHAQVFVDNLNEIKKLYLEELSYKDSKIFVTRDDLQSIVGSIRVLKWNHLDILPLHRLFNIELPSFAPTVKVWHIGRFAIKKGVDQRGFIVFKTLMAYAINEVCKTEGAVALAECDLKLLKVLKHLDIKAVPLSDPIMYLGSETVPVLLPYEGLSKFLDKYRYLIDHTSGLNDKIKLRNDVVAFREIA